MTGKGIRIQEEEGPEEGIGSEGRRKDRKAILQNERNKLLPVPRAAIITMHRKSGGSMLKVYVGIPSAS